ncbi:hypothetical protein DY000_02053978 [Brassica cretica]|uniref:Uncharacterized protein n=1 Tax=Brassica cretica TaxID=69181 RepID=A0ABQ7AGY4_BRACR|nr:hypothetical protein DY000_02053978 [Brassica cretica]
MKPSKDDDCLAPHGVSSVASRLLRQKNDANPFGRRVFRHRLRRVEGDVNRLTHPVLRQGNTT